MCEGGSLTLHGDNNLNERIDGVIKGREEEWLCNQQKSCFCFTCIYFLKYIYWWSFLTCHIRFFGENIVYKLWEMFVVIIVMQNLLYCVIVIHDSRFPSFFISSQENNCWSVFASVWSDICESTFPPLH